jgi:hypothetical protein
MSLQAATDAASAIAATAPARFLLTVIIRPHESRGDHSMAERSGKSGSAANGRPACGASDHAHAGVRGKGLATTAGTEYKSGKGDIFVVPSWCHWPLAAGTGSILSAFPMCRSQNVCISRAWGSMAVAADSMAMPEARRFRNP